MRTKISLPLIALFDKEWGLPPDHIIEKLPWCEKYSYVSMKEFLERAVNVPDYLVRDFNSQCFRGEAEASLKI
jgi:hypothetical protein